MPLDLKKKPDDRTNGVTCKWKGKSATSIYNIDMVTSKIDKVSKVYSDVTVS